MMFSVWSSDVKGAGRCMLPAA